MSSEELSARRFLTIEQVADELNVGVPLVRALLKSGELRGLQIGMRRLWRIGSQDVEDYIHEAYEQTAQRIEAGNDSELGQLEDEGETGTL